MKVQAGAVAVVATLSLGSCGDDFAKSCGEVGGASGVSMTLASNLYRDGRTVEVELCQDGQCGSATTDLYRAEGQANASVDFPRFASSFDEDLAQLTVTVRDSTRVVRVIESEVDLSYNYPNGRDCDGDQFLWGKAALR